MVLPFERARISKIMLKLIKTSYGLIALISLALVAAFVSGYMLRSLQTKPVDSGYPLLLEAEGLIDEYFAGEKPDPTSRQYGMIEGLVRRLDDPHSAFFEPVTHELQMDSLSGEYGGIGVHLTVDESGAVNLIPYPDGPASRAGVLPGDSLLSINGTDVKNFANLDHIRATFHGAVGSTLELSLLRQTPVYQRLSLEIIRETINTPSVTSSFVTDDPAIGLIRINTITELTAEEVEQEFTKLNQAGMKSLILDLRANPGGILDEAIDLARYFLSEGVILIEKRTGEDDITYKAEAAGAGSKIPLVLLVDSGTASAAEAIAAALQANHRAPLFGTRTFGKGSVQIVLELSDGSSLHITASHWHTPSGETYNGEGLSPDFLVEPLQDEKDSVLLAAIRYLNQQIEAEQ
jgi:carboxyl-terminal processing protease